MKKGFTLTELLAVIAIIAILAVAAISGYSAMTKNSKKKTLDQKINQIELAAEKYAKDINMNGSTTISVNRLVVMGYLQPDKSTDDGYSVITNPVNSENMICDLVTIKVGNDNIVADYVEGSKDCDISRTDEIDSKITIKAYEYNRTNSDQLPYDASLKKYAWTRDSVLLFVTSEYFDNVKYAKNKAIKVSYEYGGNVINKTIGTSNKTSVASSNNGNKYKEETYNELLIKNDDIGLLFDREVNVIITMKDGTTHVKTVNIRIDLESPVGYIVANNDFITTNSRRRLKLFYDDSNGSGIEGYAISETENGGEGLDYTAKTNKTIREDGGEFEIGINGIYYIYIKDKVGNISKPIIFNNNNYEIPESQLVCYIDVYNNSGTKLTAAGPGWFNQDIIIKAKNKNKIGLTGIKYKLQKKKTSEVLEKELTKTIKDITADTVLDEYAQSEEIDLTEYTNGMKGLHKNASIRTCSKIIGVDKTPPDVEFIYNDVTGYNEATKTHTVKITFTDNLSGFIKTGSTGLAFRYGWSTSKTTPPTSWIEKNAVIQSNVKQAKITITSDTTNNVNKLTGIYYFWIQGGFTQDLAQNKMGAKVLDYGFKFDNTAPDCTSSGGNPNWVNYTLKLKGKCQDKGSVQSGCVQKTISGYTYNTSGDVFKEYPNQINVTNQSPGTVYDKAGNSTICPSNQTVKIDKENPKCTLTAGTISNNSSVNISMSTSDTGGSNVNDYGIGGYNKNTSTNHSSGSATYTGYVKDGATNSGTCTLNMYKLTYNGNGGTAGCSYKFGVKGNTWGDLCGASRKDYNFKGWNTKADGSGNNITKDTKVNSNLEIFAKWELISTCPVKKLVIVIDNSTSTSSAGTQKANARKRAEELAVGQIVEKSYTEGKETYTKGLYVDADIYVYIGDFEWGSGGTTDKAAHKAFKDAKNRGDKIYCIGIGKAASGKDHCDDHMRDVCDYYLKDFNSCD